MKEGGGGSWESQIDPPPEKTTFKKLSLIRVKKILNIKILLHQIEQYKPTWTISRN